MITNWFLAARPKTLLAAFAPVCIAAAIAAADGQFHLWSVAVALLLAVSVQTGTNFCNDYFDFFQGADTDNRKGPTRAVQSGRISPRAMLVATVFMLAITGLSAWLLFLRAGWPFLILGILSIFFGVLYTAGRMSLAYLGIADLFVLVFFGPVAVAGTHYAQTLQFHWSAVVAGLGPGLIATGLLVVNNLRDIDEDRLANKKTLAVRFGATFSRSQYAVCIILSAVVPVMYLAIEGKQFPLLASLVMVPGVLLTIEVWKKSGIELRPILGKTAGLLLMYTVLFCIGLFLG